ncbi:MAG TPA: tetratricopeptide repeat protein [Candidatus Polarisedimenticolia bacterium]|nr:tetratricopeptide repeat protein [Candidatus Polarisedimenticolia bacterium]
MIRVAARAGLVVFWLAALALSAPGAQDSSAGQASRLFEAGNGHYAAGRYDEAEKTYRQLLAQGYDSAAVRYNLSNALYKQGRLGPAILELEKASALDPWDADIRENLEFLRGRTPDRISLSGAPTTAFFIERMLALTSTDQDAAVLTVLYLLMSVLTGVLIAARAARLRQAAIWGCAILCLPLLLAAGSMGTKLYRQATTSHAVVLTERVDVLSGPGDENTTLFTVHEGLKVRIRSRQGSWCLVSLDNGLNGWVEASSLGTI